MVYIEFVRLFAKIPVAPAKQLLSLFLIQILFIFPFVNAKMVLFLLVGLILTDIPFHAIPFHDIYRRYKPLPLLFDFHRYEPTLFRVSIFFDLHRFSQYENEELPLISGGVEMLPDEWKVTEQWHIVKDHLDKRHIGLVIEVRTLENETVLFVDVLVSTSLFFQFPMDKAKTYLMKMAEEEDDFTVILAADLKHAVLGSTFQSSDICDLPDYPLVLNTFWICIIQRAWRRVYLERMRRLKLRGGLKAQRQFELSGVYTANYSRLENGRLENGRLENGLRGMLLKSQ